MKARIGYIIAKDMNQAKLIGKELVASRLAACVNIVDNMYSYYWWEGSVQEGSEVILIVKTKESLMNEIIELVKEQHDYTCPCIVFIPVLNGSTDYLNWIEKETK